jgi:hypothetical protein
MADWDVLILVDGDKLTLTDEQKISFPLYDIEFETGETKHNITPFYYNVLKDGQRL